LVYLRLVAGLRRGKDVTVSGNPGCTIFFLLRLGDGGVVNISRKFGERAKVMRNYLDIMTMVKQIGAA
jgi:hypothetical protein